jgi:two-component system CheB/CheR fusion protein
MDGKTAQESKLPDLSGLTVLVVDDNQDAIEVLSSFLTACAARVLFARSAADGLAYVEREPKLDVVVTDLSMPGMDRLEFTKRIRERRLVPVIALTAFHQVYVTTEDFDAFLEKPVDLDKLCAVIKILLAKRRYTVPKNGGSPSVRVLFSARRLPFAGPRECA